MAAFNSFAKRLKQLFYVIVTLAAFQPAAAHEITPAIIDLSLTPGQSFRLSMEVNLEALMAELGSGHSDTAEAENSGEYDRLRALSAAELRSEFDAFAPRLHAGLFVDLDGQRAKTLVDQVDIPATGDLDLPRESKLVIAGSLPRGVQAFRWSWDTAFGAAVIRQRLDEGGIGYTGYLTGGASTDAIAVPQKSWWQLW